MKWQMASAFMFRQNRDPYILKNYEVDLKQKKIDREAKMQEEMIVKALQCQQDIL